MNKSERKEVLAIIKERLTAEIDAKRDRDNGEREKKAKALVAKWLKPSTPKEIKEHIISQSYVSFPGAEEFEHKFAYSNAYDQQYTAMNKVLENTNIALIGNDSPAVYEIINEALAQFKDLLNKQ